MSEVAGAYFDMPARTGKSTPRGEPIVCKWFAIGRCPRVAVSRCELKFHGLLDESKKCRGDLIVVSPQHSRSFDVRGNLQSLLLGSVPPGFVWFMSELDVGQLMGDRIEGKQE